MTILKQCADHLRAQYSNRTGGKLKSGHAHELAAAFFGYGTAAAARAEKTYPLDALRRAEIMIPDLSMMDTRIDEISGTPDDLLPLVDDLAKQLVAFLGTCGVFTGKVWWTRKLKEYIEVSFIPENVLTIEDSLAGEMAETNAYFDEVYPEDIEVDVNDDGVTVEVVGSLNGETHEDKPYCGDSINFTSTITLGRVAGRTAFLAPDMETSGSVDYSAFEDA